MVKMYLVHDAAPIIAWYVLSGQPEQIEAALAENLPATQSMHTRDTVAPSTADRLPATHAVQKAAPDATAYLPVSQLAHTACPAVVANFPALHDMHDEARKIFPAAHGMHADEVEEPVPAARRPTAHAKHAEAPTTGWYVLAKHAAHADAEALSPYFPTPQAGQAADDAPENFPVEQSLHKEPDKYFPAMHATQPAEVGAPVPLE